MAQKSGQDRYVPPPPAESYRKLQHLLAGCRPDYKGNLGPKDIPKLAADIQREQKEKKALLPKGASEFKPFIHTKQSISATATRRGVVQRAQSASVAQDKENFMALQKEEEDHCHPNHNEYHQQLDRNTGRPVLELAFQWTGDEAPSSNQVYEGWTGGARRTGRKVFQHKYDSNLKGTEEKAESSLRIRAVRQDVEDLTPRHRTALIRQITFANPKFTKDTMIARPMEHWDPMSQLLSHAYMERPPAKKVIQRPVPGGNSKRNNVRMVALMRQARGGSSAWH